MFNSDFDVKKIFESRLAESLGLNKYGKVMELVKTVNVATDIDFQRTFNGFYVVRKNADWRRIFYDYFEKVKNQNPSFADIITHLYENTGYIEPSFSSKMLATIYPEKPIWDKFVLENLGLELKGNTKEERLKNAIILYSEIEKRYEEFKKTEKAKECIAVFDSALPAYQWITDTKKIDCILWSIR